MISYQNYHITEFQKTYQFVDVQAGEHKDELIIWIY